MPKHFPTRLPPWDGSVPSEKESSQITKTVRYGVEPVPDFPGRIRDFVKKFDNEPTNSPEDSVVIPEGYWVPMSMLNWSITAQQYIVCKLLYTEQHAGTTPRERNALGVVREYALKLAWWYIRCREFVRLESEGKGGQLPEILATLNEFVWRQANGFVGPQSMSQEDVEEGVAAQQGTIEELFKPGGTVGAQLI